MFEWTRENERLIKIKKIELNKNEVIFNLTRQIETKKKYFSVSNSATSAQKY